MKSSWLTFLSLGNISSGPLRKCSAGGSATTAASPVSDSTCCGSIERALLYVDWSSWSFVKVSYFHTCVHINHSYVRAHTRHMQHIKQMWTCTCFPAQHTKDLAHYAWYPLFEAIVSIVGTGNWSFKYIRRALWCMTSNSTLNVWEFPYLTWTGWRLRQCSLQRRLCQSTSSVVSTHLLATISTKKYLSGCPFIFIDNMRKFRWQEKVMISWNFRWHAMFWDYYVDVGIRAFWRRVQRLWHSKYAKICDTVYESLQAIMYESLQAISW